MEGISPLEFGLLIFKSRGKGIQKYLMGKCNSPPFPAVEPIKKVFGLIRLDSP
jgi:hypothetical protein